MSARGLRKTKTGIVVSDGMDKSIIVEITRTVKHPFYKKYIKKRTRLMAHDESNVCRQGDKVRIVEIRPLSRKKCWSVREKIN